ELAQEKELRGDPLAMPQDARQEVFAVGTVNLDQNEAEVPIQRQEIDQVPVARAQMGIEDAQPVLQDSWVVQDQAFDGFWISGRASDDADGQPRSARLVSGKGAARSNCRGRPGITAAACAV